MRSTVLRWALMSTFLRACCSPSVVCSAPSSSPCFLSRGFAPFWPDAMVAAALVDIAAPFRLLFAGVVTVLWGCFCCWAGVCGPECLSPSLRVDDGVWLISSDDLNFYKFDLFDESFSTIYVHALAWQSGKEEYKSSNVNSLNKKSKCSGLMRLSPTISHTNNDRRHRSFKQTSEPLRNEKDRRVLPVLHFTGDRPSGDAPCEGFLQRRVCLVTTTTEGHQLLL